MNFENLTVNLALNSQEPASKRYDFLLLSSLEPTPLPFLPDRGASGHPHQTFSSTTNHHFDDTCPLETISFVEPISSASSSQDLTTVFDTVSSVLGHRSLPNLDLELNNLKMEQLRSDQRDVPLLSDIDKDISLPPPTMYEKRPSFNTISSSKRWKERYNDLVQYKNRFGHCCVPSQWSENPPLAQWVKRQRYQLKLRKEGQHSTMSQERETALNNLGFVWDPHTAFWEERLRELEQFRAENGHANVPTKYTKNPQLAIWAKCQRRQMKLYVTVGPNKSNMTPERIEKLSRLGFVFNPRGLKREPRSMPELRAVVRHHQKETATPKRRGLIVGQGI